MSGLDKKAVSPVIATVLLIGIVLVIALIIFLWFRGFTQEAIIKMDQNVELVCKDVQFQVSLEGNTLYISNFGNVPIADFDVKASGGGSFSTERLDVGVPAGGAASATFSSLGYTEIILIPVLQGESESGLQEYTCDEQYGYELVI